MNKTQIIENLSKKTGSSKAEAKRNLEALITSFSETLKKGESVTLIGFGTFSVYETKERTGRNPQTGKPIKIKAKKKIRFKAGSELSSSVN
jgi:DNA-binding protein HU-beta